MLQVGTVTAGNVTSRDSQRRQCYKSGQSQQAMLQVGTVRVGNVTSRDSHNRQCYKSGQSE